MNTAQRLGAVVLLLLSSAGYAAKPTSIVFETHGETKDGTPFAQFTVRCNDGRAVPLTAWDNRRTWCVGEDGDHICDKKQISAAKTACMDA